MSQCYDWNPETAQVDPLSDVWVQCPTGNTCCVGGSDCLDHNICHTPGGHTGSGSFSSYYVARCSDPTYTSPDCQKVCNAPGPPDAVYNFTSQQWNCCGLDAAGNVSCNDPTDEVFQAPAPAALATLSSGAAAASTATLIPGSKTTTTTSSLSATTTATTGTSSTTTTPAASSSSETNESDGLSTGAKAGVGVGVALGVLLLLGILAVVFLRRRRRRNRTVVPDASQQPPVYYNDRPVKYGFVGAPAHEKPTDPIGTGAGAELPGEGRGDEYMYDGYGGTGTGTGTVHEIGSSR